jgi:iron(III) transport system permease protein
VRRAAGTIAALAPAGLLLAVPLAGLGLAVGTGARAGAPMATGGRALASSAAIGACAAAVALLAGTSAAVVATRTRARRFRRLAAALAGAPLLAPPYLVAYALTDAGALAGRLPLPPPLLAGVALGLSLWPVVALLAAASLGARSGSLEEAALTFAPPARVLLHVTLPLAAPGALAGAAAVFAIAAADYGVPALLQARSLAGDLLEGYATGFDAGRTALGALPAIALLLVVGLGLARLLARLRLAQAPAGGDRLPAPLLDGPLAAIILAPGLALALAAVALPAAVLAARAGPPGAWPAAIALAAPEAGRSAALAAAAAAVASAAALVPSYLAGRPALAPRGARVAAAIEKIALALFLLPGSLVALGVIAALDRPGALGALYATPAALGLGLAARTLFIPLGALRAASAALPAGPEEVALAAGLPLRSIVLRVALPALARPLAAVLAVAFAASFSELALAVLLAPPGFQTLTPRLFNLMHYGRDRAACALGLAALACAGGLAALAAGALGRRTRP